MLKDSNDEIILRFEESLKKALTELFILSLLAQREYYIGELTEDIRQKSRGDLNIVFPYAAIYRLLEDGLVVETRKRSAPDGRRRQYYGITEKGLKRQTLLSAAYSKFLRNANAIIMEGYIADGE